MLQTSYAACPGLSSAISAKLTLEMCAAAENCKKKQDNVHINTESVQCISIVYSICPYK